MTGNILVRPDNLSADLCLYTAVLNSIKDPKARIAFAAGDKNLSGQNFKKFVANDLSRCFGPSEYEKMMATKKAEGYNTRDMVKYLQFLQKERYISSFTWKTCKYKDWHMKRATKIRAKEAYILFGFGLKSDERERMRQKFQKLNKKKNIKMKEATSIANEIDRNAYMKKIEKEIESEKYEAFENSKTTSNYSHGVSIGVDRNSNKFYIYDNGCRVAHEYSIDRLAERISYPFQVVVFDIECNSD